jgi:hypothetical protein
LTLADLFTGTPERNGRPAIVAKYSYQDESGKCLFEVVRFEPKDFRQRRPDGTWNVKGIRRVPFHLPQLIAAVKAGHPVYVAEGEKDVLALESAGFRATCNPGGAGKWLPEFAQHFTSAQVVIIADKDKMGRNHAADVAGKLWGTAAGIKILELPDLNGKTVKDAHDYFAAGGQAADLDEITQTAPPWTVLQTDSAPPEGNSTLPPIVDAADFATQQLEQPRELIHGILHKGSKLILGGGSKSFKTWTLLDLALSVSHGLPWLSRDTERGRVLYCNFEIQPWSWQGRLKAVAEARNTAIEPGWLSLWNLRGKAADFNLLLPHIRAGASNDFALIILDPIYKLYGQTDENKAGDVARLLNAIEDLTASTGAAVAFGAHFSKGNQSAKESIDRISGSGVFARDPDSLLVFTRHEQEDAFTVEATLRNFAPIEPSVVRWKYPLMIPDATLNPARLKQPGGRKPEYDAGDLLAALPEGGLDNKDWIIAADSEQGISKRTFYRLRKELEVGGKVTKSKVNGKWIAVKK